MSQFGGAPSGDDYGFFASGKPSAAASQFGTSPAAPVPAPPAPHAPPAGPAAAPPSSPFGSSAPTTGQAAPSANPFGVNPGFGAPAPTGFGFPPPPSYSAPPTSSRRRAGTILGVLGAAILVLVVGWFGWAAYQTSKAVVIPSTLGGRPLLQDATTSAAADEALAGIRADNPGLKVEAGIYGSETDLTVLMVARGRLDVDGEWEDVGVSSHTSFGKNQCAAVPGQQITVCIRTSRTLGVETVLVGGTVEQASAALDEAWRAQ